MINNHIEVLIERYPQLIECRESIQAAYDILRFSQRQRAYCW